jgi:phosphomannomutase
MEINQNIFKAYDIRGIYKKDFDEKTFYDIAQAYARLVRPRGRVAVGMDVRLSSPKLKKAVIRGLTDAGVDVLDIGLSSTEMYYFAVGAYKLSGGLQITASHNPKEWNGLKMVKKNVEPIHQDNGINKIKEEVLEGRITVRGRKRGKVKKRNVLDDFCRFAKRFLSQKAAGCPFKIVYNPNFGFEGKVFERFIKLRRLNWKIIGLNEKTDGRFPKGRPDPFLPQNRPEFTRLVRAEKADLGVAWDADADRVFFCDNKGRFIESYYTNHLLIKSILQGKKKEKIIYDPRYTWALIDAAKEMGAKAILERVGHSYIKERMKKENAIFSGESSGHTYFRDFWYADTGLIPLLLLLNLITEEKKALSELVDPLFQKYFISGEINSKVKDTKKILKKLEQKYKSGKINKVDGLSVEYKNWRFNVRESNTEPLLRLNVEAKNKKLMEKKRDEILKIIRLSALT